MKNKTLKITITFFSVSLLLVLISQYIVVKYSLPENKVLNAGIASFLFVFLTTLLINYLLKNTDKEINNFNKNLLDKIDKLYNANEKYDLVSKATSDTIWDWNVLTGEFEFSNGIETTFGYNRKDIGKTFQWWFDNIHPEDSLKMSVKAYEHIDRKTEKWQEYYRFLCADGSYRYILDRGFLVKGEDKNIVRIIGSMQDISKLMLEEQRLKLLETVITQTKDSIVITEANSENEALPKIVYANQAFTKLTGYKAKDVIGKTPAVFMSKKTVQGNIREIFYSLKKKEEFTFEGINIDKNNQEYWINFSMIPIFNENNIHSHWISIQRNITTEKEREKEKEQLIQELTQNNKDLKQFSYITSHNLRAPLSNLTGLLNLIEDIPIENQELKEIIDGFSISTNLLNETINDLIKIIIIKDNLSIEKEEINIQNLVENVQNQLSYFIAKQKPIINLNFEKAKKINLNKSYFESILINLMLNSLKYFKENEPIKINISSKIKNNKTIIIFEDNGIGIDLIKNKDKIFGLYQRFHNHSDGKGFGLYLVKSQIESMGGNIKIESEVNKGTTFTITFNN